MGKKHKRGKLFIDGAVQGTLARRILFHWLSLAFCLFLMTAVIHVLQSPFDPPGEQLKSYVAQNSRVFVVLALLTPAFVWDTIKVSHRFAGPVYRMRAALDAMGRGEDIPKVKFRDDDFWQDVADKLNVVRERLQAAEAGQVAEHEDSEDSELAEAQV